MRRHRSQLADIPAIPEAVTEVPAAVVEATGAALEALAGRAADAADSTSTALADIAEKVRPKRKRHTVRWLVLVAGAGGAAYMVVRSGAHNKVRSVIGRGNQQPPQEGEPDAPEPTSPPSISVTGSADAEAIGSATDGAAPEPAARDAGRGGAAG